MDDHAAGFILKLHADTFNESPPRASANFNPQEMPGAGLNAAAAGIGNR